jgi:acyl carrier protein
MEIRAYLRGVLPDYMVPTEVALLASLPTTSSGKVNRMALATVAARAPQTASNTATAHGSAPLGCEDAVLAIWRDVLQRNEIGLHDSFFDLGGDSMLLLRVAGRLARQLGREVRINDLFRYPTVASFASYLATQSSETSSERDGHRRAHQVARTVE